MSKRISFPPFELDTETGELTRRGRAVKIPPQPLRLLLLLVRAEGRMVTRQAIHRELWDEDTHVDFELGLNFCVRKLRAVLGESARKPRFIETVPRRGYSFVMPSLATAASGSQPSSASKTLSEAPQIAAYRSYQAARESFARFGKQALEDARQEFEKALQLSPDYAMAHSGLGATYSLRTLNTRDAEDLEKAQFHLLRALELDAELAEPYPWLCYTHIRKGEMRLAMEAGVRATQLQPDLVHGHYFLGCAYFASAESDSVNYQCAANCLLTAMRVEPRWQASWFILSYLALMTGEYDQAFEYARQLLDMSRLAPLPFIGAEIVLASVDLRSGNYSGARGVLHAFLDRLSKSDHMYKDGMTAIAACLLGDTEMRDGRIQEALAAYRRAWHVAQEHPRIMSHGRICARAQAGLGAGYAALGEKDRAAGLVMKAAQLTEQSRSPEHSSAGANLAELYWCLATAYVRLNETKEAVAMLRRAVEAGWLDAAGLRTDPALRPLRREKEFEEVMARIAEAGKVRIMRSAAIAV